jgi:hypothetical protein
MIFLASSTFWGYLDFVREGFRPSGINFLCGANKLPPLPLLVVLQLKKPLTYFYKSYHIMSKIKSQVFFLILYVHVMGIFCGEWHIHYLLFDIIAGNP